MCTFSTGTCRPGQVRCSNSRCINKSNRCDGQCDCSDCGDEDDCGKVAWSTESLLAETTYQLSLSCASSSFPPAFPVVRSGATVIDGSSPSSSVIRHLYFQSHHVHVSVRSIPPTCSRSSCFLIPGGFSYSICPQDCSCGRLLACIQATSPFRHFAAPSLYSFLILYFRFTPYIHLNIIISLSSNTFSSFLAAALSQPWLIQLAIVLST